MATNQELIDRVRLELGDQPTSFDILVPGNGTATRYETGTYPLDGTTLQVTVNGSPVADAVVEERTGVVTFGVAPYSGDEVRFQGVKYRYFGSVDLQVFIDASIAEQVHNRTDAFGLPIIMATLPVVELYPLSLLATIKALWALATDSSFDIDISAPDGVAIPRSERYRQLMEMIISRQQQYNEYAAALNIGINRVEVFNLRRVSKMTGRLVPVYLEQEIDERGMPIQINLPKNTYGSAP